MSSVFPAWSPLQNRSISKNTIKVKIYFGQFESFYNEKYEYFLLSDKLCIENFSEANFLEANFLPLKFYELIKSFPYF